MDVKYFSTNSFLRRWVFYCAAGEFLDIAAASAIAFIINNSIGGEPETFGQKSIVLFSMMVAGAMEGFLLGSFQWKVLKEKSPFYHGVNGLDILSW